MYFIWTLYPLNNGCISEISQEILHIKKSAILPLSIANPILLIKDWNTSKRLEIPPGFFTITPSKYTFFGPRLALFLHIRQEKGPLPDFTTQVEHRKTKHIKGQMQGQESSKNQMEESPLKNKDFQPTDSPNWKLQKKNK